MTQRRVFTEGCKVKYERLNIKILAQAGRNKEKETAVEQRRVINRSEDEKYKCDCETDERERQANELRLKSLEADKY